MTVGMTLCHCCVNCCVTAVSGLCEPILIFISRSQGVGIQKSSEQWSAAAARSVWRPRPPAPPACSTRAVTQSARTATVPVSTRQPRTAQATLCRSARSAATTSAPRPGGAARPSSESRDAAPMRPGLRIRPQRQRGQGERRNRSRS